VEDELHGIGQMARLSGLSVSALRFYDSAGVLVPAWVDPSSGYRWYGEDQVRDARVVARLRRVGLPLTGISRVLEHRQSRAVVDQVLDAHLRRLEDGLTDARRELSAARALLDTQERAMTATRTTLTATDLDGLLRAVRYAVGTDPDLPALCGVLLELDDTCVTAAATDRYRLAVSSAPARDVSGPPVSVLVPVQLVDEVLAVVPQPDDVVTLAVDGDDLTVSGAGPALRGQRLDHAFPDHRRLLGGQGAHRVPVEVAELRAQLRTAPTRTVRREHDGVDCQVSTLTLERGGTLSLVAEEPGLLQVGVDREFLLQALEPRAAGQLVLELDGPITPLAIRDPQRPGTVGLLMPTRLD